MSRLIIDTRYRGMHGIGRYASEILPRLNVPWRALDSRGTPLDAKDALNPARLRLDREVVLYSPGFGTGPSRARQILTVHDLTHVLMPRGRSGALHRAYYEHLVKPAIRRAGHVITVSQPAADDIREWLSDDTVRVHDAGNGCSVAFTRAGPTFPWERPYILYVGNFKPHKNPYPVFAALANMPDLDLIVVTSDSDAALSLADSVGVRSQVHVWNGLTDHELAAAYRGCSALVFPSIKEGFGLPVVEAWSCGAPVVYFSGCKPVANICGSSHFPVAGHDDAQEFEEVIRVAIGAKSQVPELRGYHWDDVASRVTNILEEVVGRP